MRIFTRLMASEVLNLLLAGTKVLGFSVALIALYVWVNVVLVHSQLKKVLLRWAKPDFGIISVVLFVIMIMVLSGSLLCYAFYVRDAGRVPEAEKWLYEFIGLSGLLFLFGLISVALKLLYIQPVGEEGIYQITFEKKFFLFRAELIPWSEVYDYYVRQGDFFSTVTFITRQGNTYRLEVPAYLVNSLTKIADYSIDKYAFLMRYGKKVSKSSRHL